MAQTGAYQAILPRDQRDYDGGILSYPEAASQTFKRGTPVILDSAGRIAAAGTDPALIFGFSVEEGHNGTAGQYDALVTPLRASSQWQITLLETLAQNLIGLAAGDCGLVKDATTGFWYASTANAGAQFRLVDYLKGPAGFAIGDAKVTGYFIPHTTKIQVI